MINVLVADDDHHLCSALRQLIDHVDDMRTVGVAHDGDEAVELALGMQPDVMLLDVQMPRLSGLEVLKMLLRQSDPPRIIMLTMFDLDEYVYEALRNGATGFLLKNSAPQSIVDAIRSSLDGTSLLSSEVTNRLISHLAPIRKDALIEHLTARELETLVYIGRGLSNDEIARLLFVTPTTIRTYVSRIMSKLCVSHRAQLVVAAYENGLISPGDVSH